MSQARWWHWGLWGQGEWATAAGREVLGWDGASPAPSPDPSPFCPPILSLLSPQCWPCIPCWLRGITATWVPSVPPCHLLSPVPAPLHPSGLPLTPALCLDPLFHHQTHAINPILLILVHPSALSDEPKVFPQLLGARILGRDFRGIWANVERAKRARRVKPRLGCSVPKKTSPGRVDP